MPITFTIDNQNQQTLALIEYLKTLSFVKFTESATTITKEKTTVEEHEYGIPIKYRDKIMELSRKTNKAIAKRWDETLVSNG